MGYYSRSWAESVVKAHHKAHARASYLIQVSTHVTMNSIALWLARSGKDALSNALWLFWKAFCDVLEENLEKRLPVGTTQTFSKLSRSILSEVFWTFCENCPDYLLPARDWWVEHEQQFFKARPRPRSLKNEDASQMQLLDS